MANANSSGLLATVTISKCEPYKVETCSQCQTKRKVQYEINENGKISYICYFNCLNNFKRENPNFHENWFHAISVRNFIKATTNSARICLVCNSTLDNNYCIMWQSMDFCNELCLRNMCRSVNGVLRYLENDLKTTNKQVVVERLVELCTLCVRCAAEIRADCLGKYCVAFGTDIRQFCSSSCLQAEQKRQETCAFCLQNIQIRIVDGNRKFCGQKCKQAFDFLEKPPGIHSCKNCNTATASYVRYVSPYFDTESFFCSNHCLQRFSFQNGINVKVCSYCKTYVAIRQGENYMVFDNFTLYYFCSSTCRRLYVYATKVPIDCSTCSLKKMNFDMIRKHCDRKVTSFCSLTCLGMHQYVQQWLIAKCDQCLTNKAQMFTFPMSDSSMCNFCSFRCLFKFKFDTTNNQNVSSYLKDYINIIPEPPKTLGKRLVEDVQLTPPFGTSGKKLQTYSRREPQRKRGRPKKNSCPPDVQPANNAEIECIFVPSDFQAVSSHFQADENTFSDLSVQNSGGTRFECTFGINTLRYWLSCQGSTQTDILQMSLRQLNASLAEFVSGIRKPDGERFAPDTIYYLCLGIQKHLVDNGSTVNIFCDRAFEEFRKSLDDVALTFQVPRTQLATIVEENHLWESKQLGDWSPQVLINTLIYIFTKNCYLTSVQSHMGLSLKQVNLELVVGYRSKRPPSSIMISSSLKNGIHTIRKNTYILQKNHDIPFKCPIRLCQLYVDKCPSDAKSYDQAFYLQPLENSGSGPWFKSASLSMENIQRTLNLIRMVKNINDVFVNQ